MGVLKSVVVSSVSPRVGWMGKVRSSERAWTAGFEGPTIWVDLGSRASMH